MNITRIERYLFLITPNIVLRRLLPLFPKYNFFKETALTQTPIFFNVWYHQKVKGHCKSAYWPVNRNSIVTNPENIYCGIETSPGYSQGNYIQAMGKIYIGDYTQIAANVGIISANHILEDNRKHIIREVLIGKYCWLGMGSLIMPGVRLGDYTIVGAGAVVTKSFSDGYCVIAGNPAIIVKKLVKENCVFHKSKHEYNGYIKHDRFETYRKLNLNV